MKKSVSVSNLTLNLWLDFVRPALREIGALEKVQAKDDWHMFAAEVMDEEIADEIAHCMYLACVNTHSVGKYSSADEAAQMVYQLKASTVYKKDIACHLVFLYAAIEGKLAA